ncbi:phospholipase D-like domain-containing protein [Roseomonas marmotae]|uniref:Phospholipase D n=1 Tax=Roseomonas marmotae TaxID=2768161 RepID=A0ABS3KEN5_9PROT|nr:phospholipase D-like domain-containing protein [Roseomonas marmotae]MBO1075908.1 phospholipase [Roseomonas marmotae]QTI81909.1 phospholipase [Roseomonas marmotae]
MTSAGIEQSALAGTTSSLLQPGRNCWRVARADHAAVIVDADDYFRVARAAMLAAKHRIMLVGWDFDARIRLGKADAADEAPERLGDFILWLVRRRPELEIYLLRWDIGAMRAVFRGTTVFTLMRWMWHPRIQARLDSAHPTGASHHQKIVVLDDSLAFCGGIDMTGDRWDTRAHRDEEPDRRRPGGSPYGPWHDATTALDGEAARVLGQVTRDRWHAAGGQVLQPVESCTDCWPEMLKPQFQDTDFAIARTYPRMPDVEPVLEIEQLYLDLIASARRMIYAESQYFASRRIAEAIARRLSEPDGPEIVLVNPVSAQGWLEPVAMDTARARLHEALRRADTHGRRFRLYHPFTRGGQPIYVHAKIMIVDDRVLRVGSSNLNNRSMRLDTECDVAVDAGAPADPDLSARIRRFRDGLLAEHLGVTEEEVAQRMETEGSLVGAVEALRGPGRSLRPYEEPELNVVEEWLADNEVLDPEGPEEMFEAVSQRGLFRKGRLRRLLRRGR